MPIVDFPFREWLPDQADLNNPGLVQTQGAYLSPGGWRPLMELNSPDPTSTTLPYHESYGLYDYTQESSSGLNSGVIYVNQGTAYSLDDDGAQLSTFVYDSDTLFGYADFARFGDSVYIGGYTRNGTPGRHDLFKFDTDSQTFSAVSGSIPAGVTLARISNFLVMGGTSEGAAVSPYSIRWSGFNQPEEWATSDLTLAGSAQMEFPSLGPVTAISGGDYGLIFQERGVTRLDFVGGAQVWQQTVVSQSWGTGGARSVIKVGDLHYFANDVGIFVTDGNTVRDIGRGKVSQRVTSTPKGSFTFTYASYNPVTRCINWIFSDVSGIFYNIDTGTFSNGSEPAARGESQTKNEPPYGMSEVTSSTARLARYDGDTQNARLVTGHISNDGDRIFVDGIEPQYTGSGAEARLSSKETLAEATDIVDFYTGTMTPQNTATGIIDVTADGRSVALLINFDGGSDWSDFTGAFVRVGASAAKDGGGR